MTRPWNEGKPAKVCRVIHGAAARHNVTPRMILSGSQERPIVDARREVCVELRKLKYSLVLIGKMLGGLHHSSVIHHLAAWKSKPEAVDGYDTSGEWAI